MAASKSIILLNGIAGFAATSLASLGVFEIGYKLKTSSVLSSGQNNPVYVEDEPQDYAEKIDDLGIPDGCSGTCDLTAEQLKNLKFEQRSDSSAAYDGLTDGDTFELTIEDSEDSANYPRGKKYILKKKTAEGTVTIRNLKGDDIVLGGDEGVEIREKESGGWLEKIPEKVNDLGIPKRCVEESTTKTCELTKEQLLRLKFEPKDENTSISVSGLTGDDKVSLTISEVTGDSKNYPHGKKYTLTSTSGTVTIKGTKDGDIVLENGKGVDFREKNGSQLETVENSLGIPKSCNDTCELTKEQLEKLKFETKDGSSIEIDGDGTVTLTIEDKPDDSINYPKGKKYILKTKTASEQVTIRNVKGGDIEINEEVGVEIRETISGGKLEKTPEEVDRLGIPKSCNAEQATAPTIQTCQLTKEQLERFKFETKTNSPITVTGLGLDDKVTLNVEDKKDDPINYPQGKKFTLKSTSGQITIWNVKEGVITTTQDVAIRETSKGGKLEKVPEEVDKLGIPTRCKVGSPCQLTGEELQRLTFEAKNSGGTSVSGLGSNDTVDLKVENPYDKTNYPHDKKYTLTSKSGQVRIRGVKDGDIDINAQKGVVIREKRDGGKLERAPEEVDRLGIPTRCIRSSSPCELTSEQLQRLKFEAKGNSPIWVTGLGKSDRVTLKVDDPNDKTNYPKGRRYTFKVEKEGVRINGTKDGEIVLEKGKELLVRETSEGGKLETVEDALGIPRSCNAEKVVKGSDPQTCQLTADQLKNIKFKALSGKRADVRVTGLNDATIKLTISWTENSKYPDNKKYSFDNEVWIGQDIKIIRSVQNGQRVTVVIAQKKESWFKNDGGQLELVGAKQKAEVKTEEANEILEKLGLERLKLKNISSSSDFNSPYSKKHNRKEASFYNVGELKKIKFKDLEGGAEDTNPSSLSGTKITVYFDWDNNTDKFPYNMKFTFENDSFSPSFDFMNKTKTKTVQILKKDTISNPNNKMNIFKVEKDQDKWYLVKSS